MSVCASPNVVSILIVHRYMLLSSAVNQFGLFGLYSLVQWKSLVIYVTDLHFDHSGAVPTRRGTRWFALDFTKLIDERRLILVFVLDTLDRHMYRQIYATR